MAACVILSAAFASTAASAIVVVTSLGGTGGKNASKNKTQNHTYFSLMRHLKKYCLFRMYLHIS